jgi:hypothetical protein
MRTLVFALIIPMMQDEKLEAIFFKFISFAQNEMSVFGRKPLSS